MTKNVIIYTTEGYALIEITSRTYGIQLIQIDLEDIELVQNHKWSVYRVPGRRQGHQLQVQTMVPAGGGKQTTLSFHRYLLGPAPFQGAQVDHVDGSPLNNRRENLRWVTAQQNQHNRVNARGYYWDKKAKKWRAQIRVDGRLINLGYFVTEQEARAAYQAAKPVHHSLPPGRRAV
jgi:hypothetical protein